MIFTTELDQYAMTCNLNLEKISRQFDREFQPIVYESEAPYLEVFYESRKYVKKFCPSDSGIGSGYDSYQKY